MALRRARAQVAVEGAALLRPHSGTWVERLWRYAGAVGCWALLAGPCYAQTFALPVDAAQGLAVDAGPRTPYLFSIGVSPALDLGPLRVGALIAPSYRNPQWDLALGGRVSVFVPLGGKQLGLRFAAQAEALPWHGGVRLSAGILAEVLGLLRLGLWPGYDLDRRQVELMFSVGVDAINWARFLGE